jgi:hypothetical protein
MGVFWNSEAAYSYRGGRQYKCLGGIAEDTRPPSFQPDDDLRQQPLAGPGGGYDTAQQLKMLLGG